VGFAQPLKIQSVFRLPAISLEPDEILLADDLDRKAADLVLGELLGAFDLRLGRPPMPTAVSLEASPSVEGLLRVKEDRTRHR